MTPKCLNPSNPLNRDVRLFVVVGYLIITRGEPTLRLRPAREARHLRCVRNLPTGRVDLDSKVIAAVVLRGVEKPARILELDGLRGLAVILVIFYHYASGQLLTRPSGLAYYVERSAAPGATGVTLFFVLSGFLIGGILIDARGSNSYFRTFYVRRFFRIFPIYYLWICLYMALVSAAGPAIRLHSFSGKALPRGFEVYAHFLFIQNLIPNGSDHSGLWGSWFAHLLVVGRRGTILFARAFNDLMDFSAEATRRLIGNHLRLSLHSDRSVCSHPSNKRRTCNALKRGRSCTRDVGRNRVEGSSVSSVAHETHRVDLLGDWFILRGVRFSVVDVVERSALGKSAYGFFWLYLDHFILCSTGGDRPSGIERVDSWSNARKLILRAGVGPLMYRAACISFI